VGESQGLAEPRCPQALAASRNLARSLLHHWRGAAIATARETDATHRGAHFRRLGLAPQGL
jgi:hypothetical protein